ncbi:MAG: hypothetical protein IT359_11500 [Gemmatimonadaceae bacterium]|nr:hypothetical protein [Gemmatimonadaceae bacterium]
MTPPHQSLDTLLLVTHTHWDREWYRTAGEFRLGLVDLVDELLDDASDEASGAPFLLDGQGIALIDYLEARGERIGDVARAVASGRLEAGPWFVLGDNLIPSGEALVRNLLAGREVLARLGAASPPVLYCPDAFGHPAALPTLAHGFGFGVAIVWRGYGGAPWPPGDVARWEGSDGSHVLLYHLPPSGYEFGSNLPVGAEDASRRWARMREVLEGRTTLGVALIPNGADHHARQSHWRDALRALTRVAAGDDAGAVKVQPASLATFARALIERSASQRLPHVKGELRHSPHYAWSLQGTLATRAHQKRRNALAERLMLRDVEPWSSLAWWHGATARGGEARYDAVRALWRTLLACHPHDTLCGCSIDAVACALDQRLDQVERVGALAAVRSRLALLGHDATVARARESAWRTVVVVRNRCPVPRAGIAELEVDQVLGTVPVGPDSAGAPRPTASVRTLRLGDGTIPVQELSRALVHVREESPRDYPRNRLVLRRRVLAWLPPVPALGLQLLPLARGGARTAAHLPALAHAVRATRDELDNGRCRVWVDEAGRLCVAWPNGRALVDVVSLEVEGERGDLYTPSPIPGTRRVGRISAHRIVERGPLRGALRLTMTASVPARTLLTAAGEPVRHRASPVTVTVDVRLDAAGEMVQFVVRGTNTARDASIRCVFRTDVPGATAWGDAAFGAVEREIPSEGLVAEQGQARESVLPTAPLHRSVSRFDAWRGATLLSDGLAEYEARTDGAIVVTLVRAVGELSRPDLPERPGHAGWPESTPGAQCAGGFEGHFALLAHGPRTPAVLAQVEEAAESFLLPLVGESWRSAVDPPDAFAGPLLEGEGLAFSACKRSEDGRALVLRCVNLLDVTVEGAWTVRGASSACLARLDESALAALPVREGRIDFIAPPRAVVTIRVQRC